jgi:subtilisin family serine protease
VKIFVWGAVAMSLLLGCSSGTSGDLEGEAAPLARPGVDDGVAESRVDDGQPEAETDDRVRWDSSALVVDLEEHSSRVLEVTFEVLDSIPEASLGLTGDLELLAGQDVLPLGSLSPGAHSAGLVLSAPLALEAGAEFDGSVEVLTSAGSGSQALAVTVTLVPRRADLVASELLSPSSARVYETEVGRVVRDELLVFVKGGPQVAEELAADQGLTLLGSSPVADLYQMLVPRADDLGDLREVAETLEADERVLLATPSAIGQTDDDVRYPDSDDQWLPRYWGTATPERTWHLEEIRAPQAWSREVGDTNPVGVAVIDVDFDRRHEDLTFAGISDGNVPKAGFDSGRVINGVGHGNLVSGVACAGGDNGVGITGVSWGCDLRAYGVGTQVWDQKTYRWQVVPDLAAVVEAMKEAAADGNRVVNLSLKFSLEKCVDPVTLSAEARWAWLQFRAAFVHATSEAHDLAEGRELLWVASAGNNGCGEPNQLPAALAGHEAHDGVWVSVAATASSGELSSDSNHAPSVTTLAAPGGSPQPNRVDSLSPNGQNILTTGVCDPPNGTIPCHRYLAVTGTSFAAPLVTGVAALMFSANPDLTAARAKTCLVESALDRTVRGGHPFGIVDAEAAVACASLRGLSVPDPRLTGDVFAHVVGFDLDKRVVIVDRKLWLDGRDVLEYWVAEGSAGDSIYCAGEDGWDYYDGTQDLDDCGPTGKSFEIVDVEPGPTPLTIDDNTVFYLMDRNGARLPPATAEQASLEINREAQFLSEVGGEYGNFYELEVDESGTIRTMTARFVS